MDEEKRTLFRHRTLKGGRIVVNNGYSTFDCRVRNLSETGAKLVLSGVIGIPQRFQLALDDGRRFDCELVWHRKDEVGVKFV